jgi:hypothetical protein
MDSLPDLPDDVSFATVSEFKKWLSTIQTKVALGEIKPSLECSPFATNVSVLDMKVEGPWPDYIEWYFESTSGTKRYKFTANPYHGSGGNLKIVECSLDVAIGRYSRS